MTEDNKSNHQPSDYSRFMPSSGGHDSDAHRFFPSEDAAENEEEIADAHIADEEHNEPDLAAPPSDDDSAPAQPEEPHTPDRSPWAMLSHLISWVMVPMLMPVYGILLIFGLSILNYTAIGTRLWFAAIVFGINVLVPALIVILLKRIGIVQDLGLNGRRERLIPYIVSIFALIGTAWFLASRHAPSWVWLFYIGGAAGGVINLIINFRWKISAHAAGVAGIVALLIRIASDGFPKADVIVWLLLWILLAGLTGSARLYLRRHTFWQVMAGYAVGFLSVYLITAF